jgi:hypothetical protein
MNDDQITELKVEINNFIHMHGPDAMTLMQAEHAACVLLEAFLEAQGPPVVTFPDGEPECSHDYEARDSDGRLYCSRRKHYLDE